MMGNVLSENLLIVAQQPPMRVAVCPSEDVISAGASLNSPSTISGAQLVAHVERKSRTGPKNSSKNAEKCSVMRKVTGGHEVTKPFCGAFLLN